MSDIKTVVRFDRVSFAYPGGMPVFSGLCLDVPAGVTSLVGPNGIGKTTLLLLAGARVFPQNGEIEVMGTVSSQFIDAAIDPELEETRNRQISFVYQNMEFETDDTIGEVFRAVSDSRNAAMVQPDPLAEVISRLELDGETGKRMQELSKGGQQRATIALSLLYGSPLILMDEPVFAVEPARAARVFSYLRNYAVHRGVSMLFSAHDIEFSRRHSDSALLLFSDPEADSTAPVALVESGRTTDILSRKRLEEAFRAPYDTLHKREELYREMLRNT